MQLGRLQHWIKHNSNRILEAHWAISNHISNTSSWWSLTCWINRSLPAKNKRCNNNLPLNNKAKTWATVLPNQWFSVEQPQLVLVVLEVSQLQVQVVHPCKLSADQPIHMQLVWKIYLANKLPAYHVMALINSNSISIKAVNSLSTQIQLCNNSIKIIEISHSYNHLL